MTTSTPAKPTTKPNRRDITDALWRRGVVVEQFTQAHQHQLAMAHVIRHTTATRVVVNCARRFGKSTVAGMLALECALSRPNAQIKFAAPNQKMAKKIIKPIIDWLLETCPKDLRPKFNLHDGVWRFKNGSEIHLAGSEQGQIDSLRGQSCDLALIDEAGFMGDLEYVIESVIGPQLLGRPGAKIVILSTPPTSPDHPFVRKYMEQAIAQGAYAKYTIYDNSRISAEEIAQLMKDAGGEHTTAWRREYMAEIVTESKDSVFPEADIQTIADIVCEHKRPKFFLPITVADLGYKDYTGVLFGYYDFLTAKIVIEDELMMSQKNSEIIVRAILDKERELWGSLVPRQRYADSTAQHIADLSEIHRFSCALVSRQDLEAGINRVRMLLANRGLVIDPRCKNLISQLQFATWDTKRTKFARSAGHHYDLAAAMIYLARHIDSTSNPFPPGYGYDSANDVGYPTKHHNSLHAAFERLFPYRRPTKD